MDDDAVAKFGEFLMRDVRDQAIRDWKLILRGGMKSPRAKAVYEEVTRLAPSATQLVSTLIPQIVDTTLHHLLAQIDESDDVAIQVTFNGVAIDIKTASDGLAGELYSEDGWIARYSREDSTNN